MKRPVPKELAEKYRLPSSLTDFQRSLYIHLIEWKWQNITPKPGMHQGKAYDAIFLEEFASQGYPVYPPIVKELEGHRFKKHKDFAHMASSQAACIKLFLPIPRINPRFSRLAIDFLEQGFKFEYWDEANPLNDHTDAAGTDADIAIAYYDTDGDLTLWLIEHKLTEDGFTSCGGYRSAGNRKKDLCRDSAAILTDPSRCYYSHHCGYRYWELTKKSGIYRDDLVIPNRPCPFLNGANQLWRNQLLGYAVLKAGIFKKAHLSVVYHRDNHELDDTIGEYQAMLADCSLFSSLTSQEIIEAAKGAERDDLRSWVEWYSELYMS